MKQRLFTETPECSVRKAAELPDEAEREKNISDNRRLKPFQNRRKHVLSFE